MEFDFLSTVSKEVLHIWTTTRKTRLTSSKFHAGNAPCCIHRGETVDKKKRGGLILDGSGTCSFKCFNCNFRCSYKPGRHLSANFKKFLGWCGATESQVNQIAIEALRIVSFIDPESLVREDKIKKIQYDSDSGQLPSGSVKILSLLEQCRNKDNPVPSDLLDQINYLDDRSIDLNKYDFYYSAETKNQYNRRVIIPYYYKKELIGYTARLIDPTDNKKILRYHNGWQQPGTVFNLDKQLRNSKFVIVCEGTFDAMSVDGVAVLTNEINETQAELIEGLFKDIIVVPDFDNIDGKWSGQQLVDTALRLGWNVSFPIWSNTCKDINAAVKKYGKLFTIKAILDGVTSTSLKINLQCKKYQGTSF